MGRQFGRGSRRQPAAPRENFAGRVALAVGITAIAIVFLWFAYRASHVVLLLFAGILISVLFHSLAEPLVRRIRLPAWAAVTLVLLAICGILAGTGWLLAPSVSKQFTELAVRLPEAIDRVAAQLQQFGWFNWLMAQDTVTTSGNRIVSQITRAFTITAGAAAAVVIIGFLAVYMAAQPGLYVGGIVRLVPVSYRARARQVLAELYRTLRVWYITKLITMTFTGVAIGVSMHLLDVPLALALGIVAGLLEFIPTVGPLISAVPAVLLAFVNSPTTGLYVALVYFGVQWVGNHLATPLIQQRALALPPALGLVLVAFLGAVFGFPGILLSGPLSIVFLVLVKMIYVEDVLERGGWRRFNLRAARMNAARDESSTRQRMES